LFVRDFGGTDLWYVFGSGLHPFLGGKVVEFVLGRDDFCVLDEAALEGKAPY
jgi:hypothetical protein